MAGRPDKLTPEVQEKILAALRGGNYRSAAAWAAGVDIRTVRAWLRRGREEPRSKYGEFRQGVLGAEKAAETHCVNLVMEAAAQDPKHAQWWLERKRPNQWGRKDRSEVTATVRDDRSTQAARAIARAFPEAAPLVFGVAHKPDAEEEDSGPKE
jgi:hypothetical protein